MFFEKDAVQNEIISQMDQQKTYVDKSQPPQNLGPATWILGVSVFEKKYQTQGMDTYPTKREVRNIIDSKLPLKGGYVSSPGGLPSIYNEKPGIRPFLVGGFNPSEKY